MGDTAFLKAQEKHPPEHTIVRESEDKPSQILPDETAVTPKTIEPAKPLPAIAKSQRATEAASSPEKADEKEAVDSQGIEKARNIAATPEAENTKEKCVSPKSDREELTASRDERESSISSPTTPPAVEKERQITPSLTIDKEKIVPYPIMIEEESEPLSEHMEGTPGVETLLTIGTDTIVPAPTDIEDELTIISTGPIQEQEDVPYPSRFEKRHVELGRIDRGKTIPVLRKPKEEKQALTIDTVKKGHIGQGSSVAEGARAVATTVTMEEGVSISDTQKNEKENATPVPAEIDDTQELVTIALNQKGQSIRVPVWLEQGKPVQSSLEVEKGAPTSLMIESGKVATHNEETESQGTIPSSVKDEEKQKAVSLPKAKLTRALPAPEEVEDEEFLTPVEIETPLPFSQEIQKKSDQEMLDSALEFCQASYDFWEQGDLYNAIDALDQAYSLILKVNPEDDSELLQQKEDLRITISKRIIEVYSSRFTVANGRNSVIPLVMNKHVERALNLFKGRERKFFLDSYRRSGKYRPAILRALKEAGLPEELSWLPLIESGFKIRALSRSRALGLWQFVASTGYKFGLKRNTWVDERMDPEKSTEAAIAYLKELHQIFGDWTTALAAYNCGEGKVLRCIRTQMINYLDNFWDLYERLPRETAFYVPKFLAVLHILSDPKAHGFTMPPVDGEVEAEAVTIDKQVHLKTISRYIDVHFKLLKDLNPSLRYNYTPKQAFSLKVPKGKEAILLSKLDDIPVWNPPSSSYVVHRVRRGESLSVIARRYGSSVRSIMSLNGLKSSHFIRAGWRLKIPTRRKYPIPMGVTSGISGPTGRGELVRYVVQKGDSLWRIAERFGTTTKAIRSVNRLSNTRLSIGQVLMIPQDLSATEEIKTKTYIVAKGDSPYLIAKRHHMKLSQFLRINHLSPRSTIFPGQALLVKAE